jgi:predicted dehydrogenase
MRVTVAGLGPRGQQWVRFVRGLPGWEVVAAAEPDAACREAAARALALPRERVFACLEDALGAVRADAAIVATAIDAHGEPCRLALDAGLGVLVEKPFTLGLAEARALVARAAAAGRPLLVGQNYRYLRMTRALRRLVADGVLGPVGLVVCQSYRARRELAPALARLPDSILWEIAVHHLDLLRHVLGQRATAVQARTWSLPWSAPPPGKSLLATLDLDGGTRVSYQATYDSHGHEFFERGQEFYLRAVAARGTLHVFHRWLVWCERGRWPRPVRRGPRPHSEEVVLLRQLERALATGEEPEASGRDNLATMAILEACARSAAAGGAPVDAAALLREPAGAARAAPGGPPGSGAAASTAAAGAGEPAPGPARAGDPGGGRPA